MSVTHPVGHDEYRDDRKFVMNLEPCGGGQWLLTTYRNTGSRPPVRQDKFETREKAIADVKKWESSVPLISLGEKPLELNPDRPKNEEEIHAAYEAWLEAHDLFGTLSLKRHMPYFWDARGWTEKRRAVNYKTKRERIDGVEVEISETSERLKEF